MGCLGRRACTRWHSWPAATPHTTAAALVAGEGELNTSIVRNPDPARPAAEPVNLNRG